MPYGSSDYIFLSDGVNYWIGPLHEIIMLEVDSNYTTITTVKRKFSTRASITKCEAKLPKEFFRTTRDCIVNLAHVTKLYRHDIKRYGLLLSNGAEVLMSRAQSIAFRRQKEF